MAKRFLDTLEDTLGDEVLADLIPGSSKPAARKRSSSRSSGSGRRKSFRAALEDVQPTAKKKGSGKKKSFLGALEEVFEGMDSQELDQLFPTAHVKEDEAKKKDESRITTSIDSKLLANIRKIAREHNVPLKEVVQEALRLYLSKKG